MFYENPLTKSGMFSKAGSFTLELYNQLQCKGQIMNKQKKSFSPPKNKTHQDFLRLQRENKDMEMIKEFQRLNMKQDAPIQLEQESKFINFSNKHSNSAAQLSSFKKNASRDHSEELKKKLTQNSSASYYKPKYHMIFKRSPLYNDEGYDEEKRQRALSQRAPSEHNKHIKLVSLSSRQYNDDTSKKFKHLDNTTINQSKSVIALPQCVSNRVIGVIDFSLQTKRPTLKGIFDVNEKRFEFFALPNLSYKKHDSKGLFHQQTERQELFPCTTNGLQYDSNYSQIDPKTDKLIPDFKRLPKRNINIGVRPAYTLDESICDVQIKRVNVPKFDKYRQRFPYTDRTLMQSVQLKNSFKNSFSNNRDYISKQK